jgi:hypothetical protein
MVLGVFLLLAAVPATAEKTDILLLKNGDRVTGEIDHLEGGLLIYKTDNMGTLSVEWEDIAQLTSKNFFRIELKSGDLRYGSLVEPPHGQSLQVAEAAGNVLVPLGDVAFIKPIYQKFWKRFDAQVDAGFSYTQANNSTQLSASGQATYQVERARGILNFSSLINDQDEVDATARHDVSLGYYRSLPGRKRSNWFLSGQVQSNQELGLDLRVLGAAGLGKRLRQTFRSEFLVATGLAVSEEYASSSTDKFTSTELLGHVAYTYSTYDFPKTALSMSVFAYPSLSDWWRFRLEVNLSARREIIRDFYVKVSPFESFNSDPPEEGAAENDWGVTTSLGWSY